MRRLLTTLAILLLVLVAGMTALVLLVNPNDFRHYMVRQVEQKSGYQLALSGDLRWHVWPQLSIIAGPMTLTAPGAQAPVVSADNMRLDVKLWPLLSHQLAVKQVMLKNGVIRLTPESAARPQPDAPLAPGGRPEPAEPVHWKYDIDELKVADSLLIWQQGNENPINVRDINLSLSQHDHRQAAISLSSRINRDQRDLTFSLSGQADMSRFPQAVTGKIDQLDYRLEGVDLPAGGIKGQGTLQAAWQQDPASLTLSQLVLSANDSQVHGELAAQLGDVPHYRANLQADRLNLDGLTGWKPANGEARQQGQTTTFAPVISQNVLAHQNELAGLTAFTAQLSLKAANLTYRGLQVAQFAVQADNQRGNVTLAALSGKLGQGDFSLPGTLDATGDRLRMSLSPVLHQVELGPVLRAYGLPEALTGRFSLTGTVSGEGLTSEDVNQRWQGQAEMSMQPARLHGLNVQQLIQQAVARNNGGVQGQERYERYTEVDQLHSHGVLKNGVLTLTQLQATSPMLTLNGGGTLSLTDEQCDVTLATQVTGGWRGDNSSLIDTLSRTAVPLRIYGPWQQLNYQLQVDQVLRKQLQQEARRALKNWAEKNSGNQENKPLNKLLNQN
ncbi:outer membrane assembly protein AsmA [Chimaeribacter arupi]|uniref:outer membrane assembly protein AsmA n=1 Tax=Chimaeribacter arupi TaxID=2060066 RepID=UPI000C79EFF6|nr:outer membrane assembly protein AsmA [Chimaeribacter arupi]MDV5142157.1 outer membrane assembly protein AsmA [Chimaeribacter arupi]PLR44413.1 outer membrane assembly protein AsmA [Chimaeribacter arupi]